MPDVKIYIKNENNSEALIQFLQDTLHRYVKENQPTEVYKVTYLQIDAEIVLSDLTYGSRDGTEFYITISSDEIENKKEIIANFEKWYCNYIFACSKVEPGYHIYAESLFNFIKTRNTLIGMEEWQQIFSPSESRKNLLLNSSNPSGSSFFAKSREGRPDLKLMPIAGVFLMAAIPMAFLSFPVALGLAAIALAILTVAYCAPYTQPKIASAPGMS